MAKSPFPDGAGTLHLDVALGNPLAEVFVTDHRFALVARALGELSLDLEPGVFKVKARLGEATVEQVVALTGNLALDLSDRLEIPSPAPSAGTSQTHESHMSAAYSAARRMPIRAGSGAEIVIMARRFSRPGSDYDPHAETPASLSLREAGGADFADVARDGDGFLTLTDTALGTRVDVDPGTYTLHWVGRDGIEVEQSVQAVAGWQTQVFLLTEVRHAGRHRMAVLMSRGEFDPGADAGLVEAARCALADERKVASEANARTFAGADDPMLALYGAHLMLIAARSIEAAELAVARGGTPSSVGPVAFDQAIYDDTVLRLKKLLGPEHPDVVALSTRSSVQTADAWTPVEAPPMLWRSWVLLIEASNRRPDILPASTWWPTVRQLHLRPFLAWTPDHDPDGSRASWTSAIRDALALADAPDEAAARERLTRDLLVPRQVVDSAADPAGAAG